MGREDLQKKLVEILGSNHVYFQSPSNVKMIYPAIRYELNSVEGRNADNIIYKKDRVYTIIHIYQSPKNELINTMLESFRYIRFVNRSYVDGLYNDRYELYW